jgi:hypothetical protein
MTQATLTYILDAIKTLEPDELREVERTVRGLLEPDTREAEREAALQVLQESGLVKEIKRPPMVARQEHPPVPIQGKPLSETIIEERR